MLGYLEVSVRRRIQELTRAYAIIRADAVLSTIVGGLVLAALLAVVYGGFRGVRDAMSTKASPPLPSLWGPQRTVYRCQAPTACQGADHVTFDSTIDTPNYGDERPFVDVKPAADTRSGGYLNVLKIRSDGEELVLRAYINNNADPALLTQGRDSALGTRLRFMIPAEVARQAAPTAVISASNASPPAIWDGAWVYADWPFRLDYVFGSARLTNRAPGTCGHGNHWRKLWLSDDIVSDGVLVGYPTLNGQYPGVFCAGALATIRVRVTKVKPSAG